MSRVSPPTTTTWLPEPTHALWREALQQPANSMTQFIGEMILPFIPLDTGQSKSVDETHTATSIDASPGPHTVAVEPPIIHQFRELFKPPWRCTRRGRPKRVDGRWTDLIEQWIFQLNDQTPAITDVAVSAGEMASTTSSSSTRHQPALCDLFHPLSPSGRTSVRTVRECKLNEVHNDDGDEDEESGSQADSNESRDNVSPVDSQSTPVACVSTRPSHITLMDLIIDLYSEFGVCRQHEAQADMVVWKLDCSYGDMLNEVTGLPHQLWESWSKNQRPLIQPLIQTHLITDLANITLEYLFGDESTVPTQIARKPLPTYRWRFPLLEWRRANRVAAANSDDTSDSDDDPITRVREYSPEFDLDGIRWRLLLFPNGNSNYLTPNCLAAYLELRDRPTKWGVNCHFSMRMIHPIDPLHKSLTRESIHSFSANDLDRGFNDLLKPDTIDEFTHPSDGCVVLEVSAWKDVHEVQRILMNDQD